MAEWVLMSVTRAVKDGGFDDILTNLKLEYEGWEGGESKCRIKHACEDIIEYLKEADKKRERCSDEAKKKKIDEWAEDARKLLYRLEDQIDMSMLPTSHDPVEMTCRSLLNLFYIGSCRWNAPRWGLAKLVKEVEEVHKRMPKDEVMPTAVEIKPFNPYNYDFYLEGTVDQVNRLEDLMEEGGKRMLIFIVGLEGTGKTTLARRAYLISVRRRRFHCYSWVVVSLSSEKVVLRSVLNGFYMSSLDDHPSEIDNMDEEMLREKIRSYCRRKKKYLLVLDDVVDGRAWEWLRDALPAETGCEGMIIFTTRIEELPQAIQDGSKEIFPHKGPSYELSRHLFRTSLLSAWEPWPPERMRDIGIRNEIRKICNLNSMGEIILGSLPSIMDGPPEEVLRRLRDSVAEMEKIEKDILERCKGNYISVNITAGMLRTKHATPEVWRDVLKDLDANTAKCKNTGTADPFVLSGYADLPSHLKSCFLYCSMFPENSQISSRRLIRLWVAEGYVQEIPGKTEEEAAKHQLEQLIDRNMLELAVLNPRNNEVSACSVLRLVRKIALDICDRQKFGGFVPAMGGRPSNNQAASAEQRKSRHRRRTAPSHHRVLSVEKDGNAEEITKALTRSFHLRSLLLFGTGKLRTSFRSHFPNSTNLKIWPYRLLRILEIVGVKIEFLPEQLRYLALLRYLGLRRTGVKRLPKSLGSLQYLQTLDIRDTNVVDVSDVHRLHKMRHLLLASSFRRRSVNVRGGLSCLVDLQTLAGVTCTPKLPRELRRLIQLRKFSISNVDSKSSEQLCASISKMMLRGSLTIKCDRGETFDLSSLSSPSNKARAPLQHLHTLKLGGPMDKLLHLASSLESIASLKLWDSKLKEDPMEALQYLPNLLFLSLYNSYDGKHLRCNAKGFRKLIKLSVLSLTELEKLEIESDAMPELQRLFVGYCPKLTEPPEGLGNMPSLDMVQVAEMPEEFVKKVRSESDDGQNFEVEIIPKYQKA